MNTSQHSFSILTLLNSHLRENSLLTVPLEGYFVFSKTDAYIAAPTLNLNYHPTFSIKTKSLPLLKVYRTFDLQGHFHLKLYNTNILNH